MKKRVSRHKRNVKNDPLARLRGWMKRARRVTVNVMAVIGFVTVVYLLIHIAGGG